MSSWTDWNGEVTVHDNDETRQILARLENAVPSNVEIDVDTDPDKQTFTLYVAGGDDCGDADRVDNELRMFSPHIVDALGCFTSKNEDDTDSIVIWIGPPELVEEAELIDRMNTAREALTDLIPEDAARLLLGRYENNWLRLPSAQPLRRAWPKPADRFPVQPFAMEMALWCGIHLAEIRTKVGEVRPRFPSSRASAIPADTARSALRRLR